MTLFYRLSGSFATMSFIGSLIVMLTYFLMPDLRKHPTSMVFFLSLCDCLLSLKFMITAVYPYSDSLQQIDSFSCYLQAGWAQFFGIGSIAWNGMISLNLIINLQKQGFAKTSSLSKFYHMTVWGLAFATTIVIYAMPQRIGPSGDGTIYLLAIPGDTRGPEALQILDACGIAIQGFANAMVWLANPSFFIPFKRRILDRYFSFQEGLQDSKQDINKIDTILRRNIITCILHGIRHSLKEPTQHTEVTPNAYTEQKSYDNSLLSSDNFKKISEGYEFVDYAPYVFSRLRAQAGLTTQDYMESMAPAHFLGGVLSDQLQKFSEGRSDSFFIFSPDRRFILKTLKTEEALLLLKILPNLHQYFVANPSTLLPRFYGCHGVRTPPGESVYVVVMGNVFQAPVEIHEQYDLKGSWVNRYAAMDKQPNTKRKSGMDRDLVRKVKITRKQQFLDQVSKDAMFLCSLNIMDYSLLLGFHFMDKGSLSHSTIDVAGVQLIDVVAELIAKIQRFF